MPKINDTIYLRFPDEAAFYATLSPKSFDCDLCATAGKVRDADGKSVPCNQCEGKGRTGKIRGETCGNLPDGVTHISIVGEISFGTRLDAGTNVIVQPTKLLGYHVNALGTAPDAWLKCVITPSNPTRTF